MKQSNIIFVTLLVAFVIYITVRGQLPDYFSIFSGANSSVGNDNKKESKDDFKVPTLDMSGLDNWIKQMGLKY